MFPDLLRRFLFFQFGISAVVRFGFGFGQAHPLADHIGPDVVARDVARGLEHVEQRIDPERQRDDQGRLRRFELEAVEHEEEQEDAAAGHAARSDRREDHADHQQENLSQPHLEAEKIGREHREDRQMDADAVHVDRSAERQRESGQFAANVQFFAGGAHRHRQRRRTRAGHERGQDRFAEFPQHGIRVFTANYQHESGIADENHQRDADDHADRHLEVARQERYPVQRETVGRQRENTDREVAHHPVDDLEHHALERLEHPEQPRDAVLGRRIGRGVDDDPRRQSEQHRKDDHRQELPLGQRLKRIHEKTVKEFQQRRTRRSGVGLHRLRLFEHRTGKRSAVFQRGVAGERGERAEKCRVQRGRQIPDHDRHAHPAELAERQTRRTAHQRAENDRDHDHFEHRNQHVAEGSQSDRDLRREIGVSGVADLPNDQSSRATEHEGADVEPDQRRVQIPFDKFFHKNRNPCIVL